MSTVKITKNGDRISVVSPYLPEFPSKAKRLGGKWNADAKSWEFDARDEQHIRDLCVEIYGTDGESIGIDTVTIRVTVSDNHDWSEYRSSLFFCGRMVSSAYGRDSGAKLGEGIIVLKGGFTSGGSMKNWKTICRPGTIFEIRDIPKNAVKDYDESHFIVEMIGNDFGIEALKIEKERLKARITEIDAILNRA